MFNIVYGGSQCALGLRDDPIAHLLRIQSAVIPKHADDGDIDIRKNIGGSPQNDNRAQNQEEQGKNNECVRPP